ncbi:MAG: glycine cleavage system protein H [Candidatus Brocadia sp.]|nr:glycine cleavage system protein H [Candidatus Brocadia sp.]
MIPEYLKYTPSHEWFLWDKKSITVGLTQFIIDGLDKLLFLDLPKAGDEILSGISFGEIESLDRLIDITSPIAGEVIAVNERLFENLNILSSDPYNHGWLIKFVTTETHLISELLDAREYATHINKIQPTPTIRQRKRRVKNMKGKRRK